MVKSTQSLIVCRRVHNIKEIDEKSNQYKINSHTRLRLYHSLFRLISLSSKWMFFFLCLLFVSNVCCKVERSILFVGALTYSCNCLCSNTLRSMAVSLQFDSWKKIIAKTKADYVREPIHSKSNWEKKDFRCVVCIKAKESNRNYNLQNKQPCAYHTYIDYILRKEHKGKKTKRTVTKQSMHTSTKNEIPH